MVRCSRVGVGALLALTVMACGRGPEAGPAQATPAAQPTRGTSPLESTFEVVAAEYQVPVEILKALAWVETRAQSPGVRPSITGGYGIMNLVDREDWNALEQGATLTGTDPGRIKLDDTANVRAAAAFLRQLADKSFAEYADLNPHDPADWWHALSLYPGIDSASLAQDYARDIFRTIDEGFEMTRADGTLVLAPTHFNWERHAPVGQKRDAVKEYPGAYQWKYSPNYSSGRSSSIQNVLIHTTQGSYGGAISWFQNSASNVSSHYVVRSSDGQITQMVEHKDTAWHASCYNGRSVGIEHEGFVNNPSYWYTNAMYEASGKLTRWICDKHGIPKTRSRIIGHVELPKECNKNGHYDPGSGWNWTKYMGIVTGSTPSGSSGLLKGVIYSGGSTNNRVPGATVTVAGKSVVTGTTGEYSFTLPGGTYTVSVSKSGFTSNSVSRTVTAGATIWGSMEINAVSQKGKFTGAIYQGGNVNSRVAGAVVTVNGVSVTTGTDGLYEFSLNPGTYTATVKKSGYSTNTVTRNVVASGTIWGSMEINPVQSAGVVKGAIYQNGDTNNRVAGVTVKVNGTSTQAVTGTDGLYEFNLAPGTYTMTASKAGFQNATVTRTISSGATVWGSMELRTGTVSTEDMVPPMVAITFPGDGSSLDLAVLTLKGTATDDKGAVGEVTLTINGGAAAKVAVADGAFSQEIKLSPGDNTIEVSAVDAAGNKSVDTARANFRAGISGFVHVKDDEAARIPDVLITLLDPTTGEEKLAPVTTGSDGSFSIDLTEVGRDYVLVANAEGFMMHTETISVPDDERMTVVLPLTEGEDLVPSEVKIDFIDPKDGATVTGENVTVYGSVQGFQVVNVKVNGVDAEMVGAGGFAATIPLAEGPNTINAVATGAGNESVTGTMTLHRGSAMGGGEGEPKPGELEGGCAALPGIHLLALFAVAPLLRRRRTGAR